MELLVPALYVIGALAKNKFSWVIQIDFELHMQAC
jgi:hypothetical protein